MTFFLFRCDRCASPFTEGGGYVQDGGSVCFPCAEREERSYGPPDPTLGDVEAMLDRGDCARERRRS